MTIQAAVPVVAALGLAAWLAVLWLSRGHPGGVPAVREAALVGIYAACVGGLASSLGFVGTITSDHAAVLAVAWRTAVLVAGLYAVIGAAMARRRRR